MVGQIVASVLSGGLAGGTVSTLYNRTHYIRALRTKFFRPLNNCWGAYLTRMDDPKGRYWNGVVGMLPSAEDEEFVRHRTEFIVSFIKFNELKEARKLRMRLIANPNPQHLPVGTSLTTDLMPEYEAISTCLDFVEKKLKLD